MADRRMRADGTCGPDPLAKRETKEDDPRRLALVHTITLAKAAGDLLLVARLKAELDAIRPPRKDG